MPPAFNWYKWYQFVRNDDVRRLTKQPKLTAVWAYYAHGRQRRCQEDPVSLPSGRLEKTTRSSPHHVAQHRPTGSETTPPYAPRSSRFGSDLAQNRPLWRMMSRYGAMQRELHARNDEDDDQQSQINYR